MPTLPDANSIDWQQIGLWGAGIATLAGSIIGTFILAIRRATAISDSTPPSVVEHKETKIITTDSVAMQGLAESVDKTTMALESLNTNVANLLTVLETEIDARKDEKAMRLLFLENERNKDR